MSNPQWPSLLQQQWPAILQQLKQIKTTNLSTRVKLITCVSVGVVLFGFPMLWLILKGRKRKSSQEDKERQRANSSKSDNAERNYLTAYVNGDLLLRSRRTESPSSVRSLLQQKSLSGSLSSIGGASSASTITHPVIDTSNMSPVQLCQLGFETLQLAVSYWEDGLMKLTNTDNHSRELHQQDPEMASLHHQLDIMLDSAYRMIDSYERQCEKKGDQFAFDSAIAAFTEADRMSTRRSLDAGSSSDQESFVSATDMADLSDLESNREMFQHLALYEVGLLELKHGTVPCRTLRTEMTHCLSDTEFLAKLHCIRLALEVAFSNPSNRDYFRTMGRQLLEDLLLKCDRDTEDFVIAYDNMLDYVSDKSNWGKIEEELRGRGVKCFSFYDIVLDFMLMDAFDDLTNPPSSVTTVINNRWLSNGFKETALSTAVWSVLKAKRRMLKFSDGFIAHFYSVSEYISPVLTWGFLGPQSDLKDLCLYFKDLVLGFITDLFSFDKCRYTTLEDLSEDIVMLARLRSEEAFLRLSTSI